MFRCPCSDKGGERRVETQWKRGQPSLSLSLSRAAFSLAVARGRSLPGPLYHAVFQAEKLVLAHVQKPTGPLHQGWSAEAEFGFVLNSSKWKRAHSGLCLQEKSSTQHRTKQNKEVPGPSADKTKWVCLYMCLSVYSVRVSDCFVCAGEGIKVLALLKTCQKSVNGVWFVFLCCLFYPLWISFACSVWA